MSESKLTPASLKEAMKRTRGWKECWYSDNEVMDILLPAEEKGYVYRPATSMVEWTEEGVEYVST